MKDASEGEYKYQLFSYHFIQDASEGEYEYKYQLKVTKRKIRKEEFAKLHTSDSQATDTGMCSLCSRKKMNLSNC